MSRFSHGHFELQLSAYRATAQVSPYVRALGRAINAPVSVMPNSQVLKDLLGDLFSTLVQPDPKLEEIGKLPLRYAINRLLLEQVMKHNEFDSLHTQTVNNPLASAAAAINLWQNILESPLIEKIASSQSALENADGQAESHTSTLKRMTRDLPMLTRDKRNSNETYIAHLKSALESEKKSAEKYKKQVERGAKDIMKDILGQGLLGKLMSDSKETVDKAKEFADSWGLDQSDPTSLDVEKALALMDQGSFFIASMAKLLGRLKGVGLQSIEHAKTSFIGPPTQVSLTKNLMRVFPEQRAYLSPQANAFLRARQVVRLSRSGLLGWTPTVEGKHSGSFIVECDDSGSMSNERILIAKAICLGIARALKEDDDEHWERHYQIACFDTMVHQDQVITDQSSWQDHFNWAVRHNGGGTSFSAAFEDACIRIRMLEDSGIHGVDLLFLTDGEDELLPEFEREWLLVVKQYHARLHYVGIGDITNPRLRKLATTFVQVRNEGELETRAEEIVQRIVTSIIEAEQQYTQNEKEGERNER